MDEFISTVVALCMFALTTAVLIFAFLFFIAKLVHSGTRIRVPKASLNRKRAKTATRAVGN